MPGARNPPWGYNLICLAGLLRGRCLDLYNLICLAGVLRVGAWIFYNLTRLAGMLRDRWLNLII